jgi:hypothetical protein
MKSNFTNLEIGYIAANLAPEMVVRINKAGNIAIKHKSNPGVQFVVYRHDEGLIIRRRIDTDSPYGVGHVLNNAKGFLSVKELVKYFKTYMASYPSHLVTAFK